MSEDAQVILASTAKLFVFSCRGLVYNTLTQALYKECPGIVVIVMGKEIVTVRFISDRINRFITSNTLPQMGNMNHWKICKHNHGLSLKNFSFI